MLRRSLAALTVGVLLLAACGDRDPDPSGATDGAADRTADEADDGTAHQADADAAEIDPLLVGSLSDEEAADAAAASNAFGFDLHREVAEPGENTVTSPLSASVLLAMVAAGAGGDTADAMVDTLHLDDPRDPRFAALLADLTDAGDVTLEIANALWADEGVPFEQDYLEFTQTTYGATLEEAPLGERTTADSIDAWAADNTNDLIDAIAEDLGLPDPNAVLVLLNAVYFLGEWTTEFDPDDTRDEPFTLADGETVELPTMHRTDDGELELEHATLDDHQLVRLPYGDDERFGMELLIPGEGHDLDDVLADLDAERWQEALTELQAAPVGTFALPSFELEWDATLNEALQGLGMDAPFSGSADFTPMSPADPGLGSVVQKTYIRVDEQGTEAAAVTGGVMALSAPQDVRVDRPFAFTVSDRDTGAILFLGTVHDPRD